MKHIVTVERADGAVWEIPFENWSVREVEAGAEEYEYRFSDATGNEVYRYRASGGTGAQVLTDGWPGEPVAVTAMITWNRSLFADL